MTLILSIFALLLGPLIYVAGEKNRIARRVFNVLIILAICVIVFVHIIPDAYAHAGNLAIVVAALGIAFPVVLERLFRTAADTAHLVIVILAALALLLHAVIDGIALLPAGGSDLAHAIILHRIPVGMAVWWSVKPNLGTPAAAGVFAAIIAASSIGYLVGDFALQLAEAKSIALLQAFVSGSLIHVGIFGLKHDH
jgi:zinc transporter ZupT